MTEEELAVDIEAIGEKYEEKGYFRRLRDMFSGLGMPHDTPEYKSARTELQRQAAPLIAFVSVVLFIVILVVVTALAPEDDKGYVVKVQEQEPEPELQKEDEEPEPPPDPEPQPMEEVDIPIDNPNPGPVSDITPMPSPPSEQVSVKPAEADTVAFVDSPVKMKSMVGSRNPGAIGAATRGGNGYGDPNTEAAVLKVLWWLKATQRSDGSWDSGRAKGNGTHSAVANTAFAILTYLAHGEYEGSPSPYRKDFGPVVSQAVQYLVNQLDTSNPNRPFMKGSDENEYAFLVATYALCEAYGMTKNPQCKETAMTTLSRIIKSQSSTGGWDYKLNAQSQRDDLSYGGWALQALKAGKMSGMHPDGLETCIKKAVRCLKERNFHNGHFTYCANSRNHPGLTATGCLAMQLLGYTNDSEVKKALDYMKDWHPSFSQKDVNVGNDSPSPQYYCYYATQCKYQAGMRQGASKADEQIWYKWNSDMKKLYPASITDLPAKVKDYKGGDHKQGYYPCDKGQDTWTNDVMNSCLVALQLMVYYRYLPTNQLKATEVQKEDDAAASMVDKDDVGVEVDI